MAARKERRKEGEGGAGGVREQVRDDEDETVFVGNGDDWVSASDGDDSTAALTTIIRTPAAESQLTHCSNPVPTARAAYVVPEVSLKRTRAKG